MINRLVPILVSLTAIAALSACSSGGDDIGEPTPAKGLPLKFAVGSVSKAQVNGNVFQQDGTAFKVFGSYVSTTDQASGRVVEFDGVTVTRSDGKWLYDDIRYWIPGQTYDFTAVYPAAITPAMDKATGRVAVNNFSAAGTDLLAANVVCETGLASGMAPVTFDFVHLLSRVSISGRSDDRYLGADGKPDDAARKIRVTALKIYGVATTGTWSGENISTVPTGAWTLTAADPAAVSYSAVIPDGGVLLGSAPTEFTFENVDGGTILALPQNLENVKIEITYEYTSGAIGTHTESAVVSGRWSAGKSYSYSFKINTHIFFDVPVVDDWTTAPINNNDFNIDLTNSTTSSLQ